jgi:acyl-coenzyme A thioesterase PaaI-like protein
MSDGRVARVKKYGDFTSPESDHGLPIEVTVKGDTAYSEVTIPPHMAGWRGPDQIYAHKGAVATVLETVMAFSGIRFLKKATNAKSLFVEYFTQVPVKTKLRAEAKLMQQRGESEAIFSVVLSDAEGRVLAQAAGTYALYSVEQLRNLSNSQFKELALGPGAFGFAACRPEDLSIFEQQLAGM